MLDKINILIEPKYEWDSGISAKKEQILKQAKLTAAELFASKQLLVEKKTTYTDFLKKWCLSSIVNKVIDNVQITVREVHIRYEDHW